MRLSISGCHYVAAAFQTVLRLGEKVIKGLRDRFGELNIPDADTEPATKAQKIESMLIDARAKAAALRQVDKCS